MARVVEVTALLSDVYNLGSGPNQAHFAPNDVEELGKFIEAEASKYASNSGVPRIVVALVCPSTIVDMRNVKLILATVGRHRAELVDRERLLTSTNTLLAVQDAFAKAQTNHQRNRKDRRTGDEQYRKTTNDVEPPLDAAFVGRSLANYS